MKTDRFRAYITSQFLSILLFSFMLLGIVYSPDTMAMQQISELKLNNTINRAGLQRMLTQRMLSQRIELFYLLRNRGFTEPFYLDKLAKARKQFTEGLEYLNNYQGNTPEIKALLEKAGKSYRLFEHSLDSST